MEQTEQIIAQTKKWITDVVIGCNFCPFAAREMKRNTVHYIVSGAASMEESLSVFLEACRQLDQDENIETTLVIFPNQCNDFEEYLDLVEMAEELLEEEDYEGVYQVASFHPEYRFAGVAADDPANYTNRSPYPMLHLLREESLEKALEFYKGDPEEIPENNIRFAREKGLLYMKMLRDNCF